MRLTLKQRPYHWYEVGRLPSISSLVLQANKLTAFANALIRRISLETRCTCRADSGASVPRLRQWVPALAPFKIKAAVLTAARTTQCPHRCIVPCEITTAAESYSSRQAAAGQSPVKQLRTQGPVRLDERIVRLHKHCMDRKSIPVL